LIPAWAGCMSNAADAAATPNNLSCRASIALQTGRRGNTNTSTLMGKETKKTENQGQKMKSKKQRRFERRLAVRRLRRQMDGGMPHNGPDKSPGANPSNRATRGRGECSKNPSSRLPGSQEPGVRESRENERR
jgi:hypothetical protein